MWQIKYMHYLLMVTNMISFNKCSLLSKWKFGYESKFLPWNDYNRELSECATDEDCEELFPEDFKYPPDSINVTDFKYFQFYKGVYELAEPWGGFPHLTKYDRSYHIFYLKNSLSTDGWCFDN